MFPYSKSAAVKHNIRNGKSSWTMSGIASPHERRLLDEAGLRGLVDWNRNETELHRSTMFKAGLPQVTRCLWPGPKTVMVPVLSEPGLCSFTAKVFSACNIRTCKELQLTFFPQTYGVQYLPQSS